MKYFIITCLLSFTQCLLGQSTVMIDIRDDSSSRCRCNCRYSVTNCSPSRNASYLNKKEIIIVPINDGFGSFMLRYSDGTLTPYDNKVFYSSRHPSYRRSEIEEDRAFVKKLAEERLEREILEKEVKKSLSELEDVECTLEIKSKNNNIKYILTKKEIERLKEILK